MIKAIISDSDGTILNTLYLIRHGQYEVAVEYLLGIGISRSDIPECPIPESFINKSVGGSTRETLEKTIKLLYGKSHQHQIAKINFDDLDKRLAPVQDRIEPLYVYPYHGLTEFFTWLGQKNISLGIFTSGDQRMIVRQ